ncbi:neuropeptide CCHamide-1 receptor-like [Mya arenaria]|uniref:neuropeptide CCHamide-1 receptor-like n=1 Tax=Mya arenaria TaxID=6604 RepID=UPI0022DEB3D2|nr:neuropeptide CCHamide-1 receptor-like [Mya arenaria]XP_052807728.1 neuropeptide CCHamide-1 receptor-like [Mya arenaria]
MSSETLSQVNGTVFYGRINTTGDGVNSTPTVDVYEEPHENVEAILVPILFAIIFLIGVVGNVTLIFTVLKNKSLRNTPNIFVVSLSIGDLLLLLCSVPFSSTLFTCFSWPFGRFLCKFNEYMQTLSLGVSVFTLTALSGDRYIAIVHPMSKHTGKPTLITVVTVVGIWILSAALAIPEAVTSNVLYFEGGAQMDNENTTIVPVTIAICKIYPEDSLPVWYSKAHSMYRFIVFFVIPLLVIAMFYVMMARILVISSKALPCESVKGSAMNQQQKRQIQARLKVAKVVLSFVAIFAVCWLPRHISILAGHFADPEYNMSWHVLKITSFCLTYIYSCVNPYALYFLSSQFRKYYNRYLFCCCPKGSYIGLAGGEHSAMYNFKSTMRRGSMTCTGVVHSQSIF